jgi:NADH dehydrogenase
MNGTRPHRIVILGGGFGGLYTALRLDKTIARRIDVEVTLVNRENFFLFTPMLHEVAASDLDITNIVNPIRKMLRRVHFFAGDVDGIDLGTRQVTVSHGIHPHHHVLEYDQLAIGRGAITNFPNLPGLAEHALTMKTLGDAIYLRNRTIAHLEEANFECKKADRGRLLTFVIAGGGFAGIETASALNDFLREALRFYVNLDPAMINVLVVHPGAVILPELSEKLGRYAQRKLGQRKIDVRVNCRVTGISKGGVELSDGSCIETDTLICTAGVTPNPKLDELPCAKERGRIAVNEYMEVAGFPGVWALGDCATIPDPMTGKPQPRRLNTHCARAPCWLQTSRRISPPEKRKRFRSALWTIGLDWKTNGSRQHSRHQLLRIHRLVAMPDHLSAKIAEIRKEGSRPP